MPHELTTPLRPMRPCVDLGSAGSILPLTIVSAWISVQVGRLNELALLSPVNETVSVKLMVVPQTRRGCVLTLKGTVLLPSASMAISGYGEFGCVIVTPAVKVLKTAVTLWAGAHPKLLTVTFRLLHSLASMTPFPLPPEIAVDAGSVGSTIG